MYLKLIFSHFMTGENTDCRSGKVKNSSNLPDRSVPKDPAQSQTYRHYSKIPKLVPTTENIKTMQTNPNKI